MNAEVKRLWVKALRSGQYKQAQGALHRPSEGFCCLGVLCDVAVKAGALPPPYIPSDAGIPARYGRNNERGLLPKEVVEWAELQDNEGAFTNGLADERSLTYENDNGTTFGEIADIIEKKF